MKEFWMKMIFCASKLHIIAAEQFYAIHKQTNGDSKN